MHQPMQGAHAQRIKPTENDPDMGWHRRKARNSSKAHYYVEGRSLCGKQSVGPEVKLENFLHHASDNCETCMKRRDKLYGNMGF